MAKKKAPPKTHAAEMIFRLSKTTKKKEKFQILDGLKDDQIAQSIFYYALNPYWTFGILPKKVAPIKDLKAAKHIDVALLTQWPLIKETLDKLRDRELTGNAAREAVKYGGAIQAIWQRILSKDLRCGVHVSTINEAMNTKWLPTFEVALADEGFVIIDGKITQRVNIEYPIWAEPKYDGVRTIALANPESAAKLYSRNGKDFENFPSIVKAISEHEQLSGLMLDGEVDGPTFDDVTKVMHAKDGRSDSKLFYRVWDCMIIREFDQKQCDRQLSERQKILTDALVGCDSRITQAPGCMVTSEEHLLQVFTQLRADGYEGLVLKPIDGRYSYKRSKDWIKVKEMFTDEFKVVGFNIGKGKHSKVLGALVIRVGKISVEVGSGFTDAQRKEIWKNRSDYVGNMAEVKYQEKTKLKADGTGGSLRFPTFLRWRPDKDDDPAPF